MFVYLPVTPHPSTAVRTMRSCQHFEDEVTYRGLLDIVATALWVVPHERKNVRNLTKNVRIPDILKF